MVLDQLGSLLTRRAGSVVALGAALAIASIVLAPDLTRLVADGPVRLLPESAESRQARAARDRAWPDQAASSIAVGVLRRPGGLDDRDHEFVRQLAHRFQADDRPSTILGIIDADDSPETRRLISDDRSTRLVVARLGDTFFAPSTHRALAWLEARAAESSRPDGLEITWTGDAAIGAEFLGGIRATLDRAAIIAAALVLVVLLIVYRSIALAMVPLLTIATALAVARGVLGLLVAAGFEVSVLAELFLVVILFGCGTDFCLLLISRFVEARDLGDTATATAIGSSIRWSAEPMITSCGTVMAGLILMAATRFTLFARTGPPVAIGLALTTAGCLTIAPALIAFLARWRPRAFDGLASRGQGPWPSIGRSVLARPILSALAVLVVMAGPAFIGARTEPIHDLPAILPAGSPAVAAFRQVVQTYGPESVATLTVVLESDRDFRSPNGLALIDDLSRIIAHNVPGVGLVRSISQPTGDPTTLDRARVVGRLDAIRDGIDQARSGSRTLKKGLAQAEARARIGRALETGLFNRNRPRGDDPAKSRPTTNNPIAALIGPVTDANRGAGAIADGLDRAFRELTTILDNPEVRDALKLPMITRDDQDRNPQLNQALTHYVAHDGQTSRIEVETTDPLFSASGIATVERLRSTLQPSVGEGNRPPITARVAGTNADWADVARSARDDRHWITRAVPVAIGLILLASIRNPIIAAGLVASMMLTYAFAMGVVQLVFVHILGGPGIDWAVPYFLFILIVAIGVDYNVFLMARLREESDATALERGPSAAIGRTGGLISSAAAITACSFAAFLGSPLASLRQLGLALIVGITADALLVRPVLIPACSWIASRAFRSPTRPDHDPVPV